MTLRSGADGFRPYCVKCGFEVDIAERKGSAWMDDEPGDDHGLYYGLHTECRLRDAQDPVLALIAPPQPTLGPAVLAPFEREVCNVVDVPGQRRTLTRHHAAPQVAPRVRWRGREYDYLGDVREFLAYDDEEHGLVLCDDDGRVTVVESDLDSGWLLCQCQKCGRWHEDVQEGYGPDDTIVWECPEYCGWQADMDSGRWSE